LPLAGLLSCLFALLPALAGATELKPEAARGFDAYVHRAEARMQGEVVSAGPFLWVDGLPDTQRAGIELRMRNGEIVTERLEDKDSSEKTRTPGAKIHHWLGTIFIPGATLKQILFLAQDYDEHQKYFQPEVLRSKLVARAGDDFKIQLRLKQTRIISVVFDTDHEVHYTRLDATRAYSISRTTRVVEVIHAGEPGEYTLPEGNDQGFLWRLNSYWRFSEKSGGVYLQCEAISLSRDIPLGLNFLIGHFVEGIARQSLESTLQSMRTAALDERFRKIR